MKSIKASIIFLTFWVCSAANYQLNANGQHIKALLVCIPCIIAFQCMLKEMNR